MAGPKEPSSGLTFPRRLLAVGSAIVAVALPALSVSGTGVFWTLLAGAGCLAAALTPPSHVRPEGASEPPGGDSQQDLDRSVIGMLPPALLVLIVSAIGISMTLSAVAPRVLSSRAGALVVWTALILVLAWISWRRGGRLRVPSDDAPTAAVGAVLAGVGMWVAITQPFAVWSRLTIGTTDFNRHLVFMRELADQGGLTYATNAYPRGVHSLVTWVWVAAGGDTYADAWRALESSMWLFVVLLAVAATTLTVAGLRFLGADAYRVRWLSAGVLLLVLGQSAWVTAIFRFGFVTSLIAGLVIVATASMGTFQGGAWFGTPWSIAWLVLMSSLLVHNWLILVPTMALPATLGIVIAIRERRRSGLPWGAVRWPLLVACVAGLGAVPGLLGQLQRYSDVTASLSTAGFSGMLDPEYWWLGAIVLAMFSPVLWWQLGRRSLSALALMLLVSGAFAVVFVASTGRGTGEFLNYYASKTLWTMTCVVIPLATVAGSCIFAQALKLVLQQAPGPPRLNAYLQFGIVMTFIAASVLGRMSGTPSQALVALRGVTHYLPINAPMMAELERRGLDATGEQPPPGVLVWGLMPSMTAKDLNTYRPGNADSLAREATAWLGLTTLDPSPLEQAFATRDVGIACDYLRTHPDAVRITGPNPAAGAPWLIDGGCPAEVVKPDLWISVPIDESWVESTWLEGKPYVYPTYQEFQDYLAQTAAQQ